MLVNAELLRMDSSISEADEAFARMVTTQVARVTQELAKLEQLLKAGMVDPGVLKEFRKVIDEVRKTSWNVHQNLSANQKQVKTPIGGAESSSKDQPRFL